jgi:beta-lactamase superfamily II metal-dependent hydrolase
MLEVDCWDVGQGDCTVIRLPSGGLFLIDVGPLRSPVIGWLNDRRMPVEGIAITHNDADHAAALPSIVMQNVYPVRKIYMLIEPHREPAEIRDIFRPVIEQQKAGRLNLTRLEAGELPQVLFEDQAAGITIEAIFPRIADNAFAANNNETSAVIVLKRNGTILGIWPGDAQVSTVATFAPGQTQSILVGPHHGAPEDKDSLDFKSNVNSTEPKHLFISVGTFNQHNHPNEKYLSLRAKSKCPVSCSQITAKCDRLKVAKKVPVLQSSMLLGLRAPSTGVQCRGAIRFALVGNTLEPDQYEYEHRQRIAKLLRPICRR